MVSHSLVRLIVSMNHKLFWFWATALAFMVAIPACSTQTSPDAQNSSDTKLPPDEMSNLYEITTPHGRMVVRLYDETPLHRDNFRKIVAEGVLESTLFHRVINQFMIQGGDPNSRDDDPTNDGSGGPGYTIPAEIDARFFHKRGALSAARQGDAVNPRKESSGSQFYIVHGRVWTESGLAELEENLKSQKPDFSIPPDRRAVYTTEGGTPHLDDSYTVFGELIEGFEILDTIASVPTTGQFNRLANRPLTDIPMVVRPLTNHTP